MKEYQNINSCFTVIAGAILICLLLQRFGKYCLKFHLKGDRIVIYAFCVIPVMVILKEEISEIAVLTLKSFGNWKTVWSSLLSIHFNNKIWGSRILISRRCKFFKYVIISPENVQDYLKWFSS